MGQNDSVLDIINLMKNDVDQFVDEMLAKCAQVKKAQKVNKS